MAIVLALLVPAIGLPAVAAAAPYEPNDSFAQAHGPLQGGTDYSAAKDTDNDEDYYYFNTSGQRQLDISVIRTNAACDQPSIPPLRVYLELLDDEGTVVQDVDFGSYGVNPGVPAHILHTSPGPQQYVLRTRNLPTGCTYRFRIDPPDAVTTNSPGVVVDFGASEEADDVQTLSLNGAAVAAVPGRTARSVYLGPLAADARIGVDATNSAGQWSWNFAITNFVGRTKTTLLSETQSGGVSSAPRVGTVRHVVITPLGAVAESCGEATGQRPCIPVDNDRDGVPQPLDCNDASAAIRPGAREIPDNDVDENCDGVIAKRVRAASKLSLSRQGRRYRGRVSSTRAACLAKRRVVLRRVGSGTRSFGSTRTRSNGTWSISRARLRGRVYAVVATRSTGLTICRAASSRRIRG